MEQARLAQPDDFAEVMRLLERDPIESVAIGSWLEREGPSGLRRATVWMYGDAVCYSGVNLLPVFADDEAAEAFARRAIDGGRRCSSIVGRLPATAAMWAHLEPFWGKPRAIRTRQIVMVSDRPCTMPADPEVRVAEGADFAAFYSASVEMYIEEIEASPIAHDGGTAYRSRTSDLISNGYAFIRTDGGRVVFKAELGAVTAGCAQLQGVWVHPDLRGRGIGVAGTAAVRKLARERGIGTISLAVNDFNSAARWVYQQTGFRDIAEQMVVLF